MNHSKSILVFAMLLGIYVMSYLSLSRNTLFINAEKTNIPMYYYVPFDAETYGRNATLQYIHVVLSWKYYPIWKIDHAFFDGPFVAGIPLMELNDATK